LSEFFKEFVCTILFLIYLSKDVNEDDEDSNEEGNWRNDYPDEDEYGDEDIDDENDEDGRLYYPSRKANHNDEDYDDDYDEYGNGNFLLEFNFSLLKKYLFFLGLNFRL